MAEDAEAVLAAVPDVPDEWALLEQFHVLSEEVIAERGLERPAGRAGFGEESIKKCGRPGVAVGASEEAAQALSSGPLATDGDQRDETIGINELIESVGLLIGPAVSEQAGDRHLERS